MNQASGKKRIFAFVINFTIYEQDKFDCRNKNKGGFHW